MTTALGNLSFFNKRCSYCGQFKLYKEFNKGTGYLKLQSRCKSCLSKLNKSRYLSSPKLRAQINAGAEKYNSDGRLPGIKNKLAKERNLNPELLEDKEIYNDQD